MEYIVHPVAGGQILKFLKECYWLLRNSTKSLLFIADVSEEGKNGTSLISIRQHEHRRRIFLSETL